MRLALAILLIPFSAPAASLTGTVIDQTGAYIPHADVELVSETNNYRVRGDDAGVYQFSSLPAGEYTLTFRVPGFNDRRVKSIGLLEGDQKRIPDVTLDIEPCGWPRRDINLLPPGETFGRLTGSVNPPAAGIEVTLVCRTFSACRATKTDSSGRFSFERISAGAYGLSFHRDGFYDQEATGYEYTVNAGWESVYTPVTLEQCANDNCAGKIQRILPHCE
jgi:hypothetical protein